MASKETINPYINPKKNPYINLKKIINPYDLNEIRELTLKHEREKQIRQREILGPPNREDIYDASQVPGWRRA